ncbi:FAD-binding oxidoreductase [Ancylobacter dichloromethanicus]|uniref:D-amino-acid oxidase n=1 Tax=Ancylobacter dichloromethanicus TaxID=518825 RepID=A0A9W6J8Z8_9HYPH|nr:FAD-binding oxidoreductase [Ancylobacter dichloromethanicus]MBS7553140.1 FAD-binding oxidoreductase [Ancylobacter dichloromethanicus]GLK72917.1 D-amino-acid oxidase [Ancylobacter dichloromethanicus]
MGPQVVPVSSDPTCPPAADVVIVGGGIIGTTSALYLAERGLKVVLCEKGHIAGEQSSRNWGWCRQAKRDPREFELIREALALWRGMDAHIGASTGFATTGILFAANDASKEASFAEWVRDAAGAGIHAEMLAGAQLAQHMPGDATPPPAALWCASDGRAEPQKAAPAIAEAARRRGAVILADCAVRGIETGGGRVIAAVTECGRIATGNVVVAGGAWTRRILRDVGIDLPQLKVRASVLRTSPVENGPEPALWDHDFAFRRREDGGYTIANGHVNVVPIVPDSFRFALDFLPALRMEFASLRLRLGPRFAAEWREAARRPFDRPSVYEEVRVLDPAPDNRYLAQAFAALQRRFPAFAQARIVQSWAGFIDATPDAVPVISAVESVSGLVVATGFSGHGFGIGPGAGHLVADLITAAKPIADPHPYRLSRFFDGSRPRPMAGL